MSMGLGGVCLSTQPANVYLPDEERGTMFNSSQGASFNYRMRNFSVLGHRPDFGPYFELWSRSSLSGGDPTVDVAYIGQDSGEGASWDRTWEQPDMGLGGIGRNYFIRGNVQDASTNPLPGSLIQAFRTSDNLFMGSVIADANGNYACPTPDNVSTHYLVSYYNSSPPKTGATVNTLTASL